MGTMARLLEKYQTEIVQKMMERFGYGNRLQVPRISKVVVSMGVGKALEDGTRLESAMRDLAIITGQKPKYTKARMSVAGFKLRSGNRVGCMVTLRRKRMYEFLDRLINITMPRIRDFRGLSLRAFDKAGNYSLGLQDQYVFPEIDVDKIDWSQGMNINIVIENSSKDESIELLKFLGMPFKRD
jgi:large subunit ribosomal protein L5